MVCVARYRDHLSAQSRYGLQLKGVLVKMADVTRPFLLSQLQITQPRLFTFMLVLIGGKLFSWNI